MIGESRLISDSQRAGSGGNRYEEIFRSSPWSCLLNTSSGFGLGVSRQERSFHRKKEGGIRTSFCPVP